MSKIKSALVPKLRFPEFKDCGEWEEKKLEKVAYYENGKAHEDEISENGKYIVVNSKFISTEGKVRKYTDSANLLADKGDILMVLSDVPNGRAIAKCYYVDKDKTYTVNQRICKLTSRNVVDLFLFLIVNRNVYFLSFDDGVKQTNLKKDDVLMCPLIIPKDKAEQQKIADCLSSLDDLITAEAKKLAALKEHKKGLMQKLFPAEGKTVPELRFSEFRDEWKLFLFKDFARITTGNKDTQNKVDNGKYPFFVRSQNIEKIDSYTFDCEAILTSGDGVGVGKNFHYIVGKFDFHQRVYCIYDFANNISGKFVYQYFSEHFQKRVMQLNAKNSVDSVRMSMIADMPIYLPELKEQQKIADCLSSLDDLITAQTEKIETLKLHKKGLMQGLFPGIEQ